MINALASERQKFIPRLCVTLKPKKADSDTKIAIDFLSCVLSGHGRFTSPIQLCVRGSRLDTNRQRYIHFEKSHKKALRSF